MIFVLPNIFKTKLISPFFQGPDQTEKISQRITAPLVLDLTKVKTLSSLNNIPRYLVYNNETGKVYYAKGTDTRMSPASFTKLLSSQVALDLVPKEYLITATKDSVAKVPTILGLKVGDKRQRCRPNFSRRSRRCRWYQYHGIYLLHECQSPTIGFK
jgi:D-alanyl-D-alanine carboxypeptidase